MDNLEGILNLLFRRVSVKNVLDNRIVYHSFDRREFIQLCFAYDEKHSEPEISNMWMYYKDRFHSEYPYCSWPPVHKGFSVFEAMFYYVNRMLTIQNNEIMCRYNELLHWRKVTFALSEELMICAYWAANKEPADMEEIGFAWRTVIRHNNFQLNQIMQRGISENHFHLYGSAPIFHISWLSVMNHITESRILEHLKKYDLERRYTNVRYSANYEEEPLAVQCCQAAFIRVLLFSKISNKRIHIGNYRVQKEEIEKYIPGDRMNDFLSFCRDKMQKNSEGKEEYFELEEVSSFLPGNVYEKIWEERTLNNICSIIQSNFQMQENLQTLQNTIEALQNEKISEKQSCKALEDYALGGKEIWFDEKNKKNNIFSGERWLLYSCLRKICKGEEDERYGNLLYGYILIKETIRSELIQANQQVGFENFQKYQRRKNDLITDPIFKTQMVRYAVAENLMSGYVQSMEIRISPCRTVKENYKYIQKLDNLIGPQHERYFYTMHFIKSEDMAELDQEPLQCRNYNTRKKAEVQAIALRGLREMHPQCAARILGIDAASNELGCRPEVFASAFRYLRNHIKLEHTGKAAIPQLRITYHVGEEFLDLADGLRAIDEAVNFLNMDCGDRLGHAMALGMDVESWYQKKGNRILIAQQDYLDNLVWIYNRLIQFNIKGMDILKSYIEKEYSFYFHEIYAKFMDYNVIRKILRAAGKRYTDLGIPQGFANDRYQYDIFQYYTAWKIRGDDPSLYKHGYFCKDDFEAKVIAEFYPNKIYPKNFNVRYIPEVFLINYYYHFDRNVRQAGQRRIEVKVKPFYIQGVKVIQKEMQKKIVKRGIGIETNPSSNYLIGNFKDYAKHPILNFYNKELIRNKPFDTDCQQLSVSVNTDDMGVFSTSLENEYGLLANALENLLDEEGNPLYNKSDIYDWIDAVRQMGNDQSFNKNEKSNNYRANGLEEEQG